LQKHAAAFKLECGVRVSTSGVIGSCVVLCAGCGQVRDDRGAPSGDADVWSDANIEIVTTRNGAY